MKINPGEYSNLQKLVNGAYTAQELRSAYSALRSVARKRIERLQGSRFGDFKTVKKMTVPPSLSTIGGDLRALQHELASTAHFLQLKQSTISGFADIQARRRATLKEHGYTVAEDEEQAYWDFMDDAEEALKSNPHYDSDRIYAVWQMSKEYNISPEQIKQDFDYWYDNIYSMQEIVADQPQADWSAESLREMVANWK